MRTGPGALLSAALAVATLGAATGCAPSGAGVLHASPAGGQVAVLAQEPSASGEQSVAVPAPRPLRGPVREPDLVVVGQRALPRWVLRRIGTTDGVQAALPMAMATAPVGERLVTIAAVDPSAYRRFTPEVTARADAVWQRVADGDLAMAPEVAEELRRPLGGYLTLGNQSGALTMRVGATASMAPKIDAVVNEVRGDQLGMVRDNAVLIAADGAVADAVAEDLRRSFGGRVTVTPLTETLPDEGRQTAFLTGGSVAEAVGSFGYRYYADGSVDPDPAWVAANIRTEPVPVLGDVTCHRVMLPQLRAALQEVVDSGLADRIDPGDFGGCYTPRFIGSDPSRGLSLHTWGIAVDLNVQGNLRGSTGEIDRRVVAIFKRWGFAWGGDWAYTDPMHFELAALVRPR